jgi:transmembrane sensor
MTTEPGLPSDQVDWDALARYFAGESSAEEAEAASRWLAEHPDEAEAFAALDAVTARVGAMPETPDPDVDAAWQRVAARLDAPESSDARDARPATRRPKRKSAAYAFERRERFTWSSPALRVAAAIVALAAGSTMVWRVRTNEGRDTTVAAARTYETAPGQRDSVVLADGTGVLLGPGSSLRIETGFGDRRRDVHLDGEALFDVRHDDARPFVVHTSTVMIHDLGTTFTVRTTNGTNGTTTVAVTQGSVRIAYDLRSSDSGVVLRAGDRGTAVANQSFTVDRGVPLADELAFTRGQLVFRDTPLPAVAASLRRWYGMNVRITDSSLNTRTLTASFNEEPVAEVLKVIGLALDTPVQQQDSVIVIGRGGRVP